MPGDRRTLRLERPAARRDHHDLGFDDRAGVGGDAEQRMLRRANRFEFLDHFAQVEGRRERVDLLAQVVDELLAGDHGIAGNVVYRLFRIELGALAADLGQNVDQMGLDVEQAQFEHREQADRPGADDDRVGVDDFTHYTQPCLAGVVTTRPSSASVTFIWQERREFGRTSAAKSSMSSSICEGLPTRSVHSGAT